MPNRLVTSDSQLGVEKRALTIDRLVITAVSALHHAAQHKPWQPPSMGGTDRDGWSLPNSLTPGKA